MPACATRAKSSVRTGREIVDLAKVVVGSGESEQYTHAGHTSEKGRAGCKEEYQRPGA